jgi:hypothetical protein
MIVKHFYWKIWCEIYDFRDVISDSNRLILALIGVYFKYQTAEISNIAQTPNLRISPIYIN